MAKFQPYFDFDWLGDQAPSMQVRSRPSDSTLFVVYIKQVVPQLIQSDKPIHRTAAGYATNSSPWSEFGRWEFDTKNQVITHQHKEARWVGNKYEYAIVETPHRVVFADGMMIVE